MIAEPNLPWHDCWVKLAMRSLSISLLILCIFDIEFAHRKEFGWVENSCVVNSGDIW